MRTSAPAAACAPAQQQQRQHAHQRTSSSSSSMRTSAPAAAACALAQISSSSPIAAAVAVVRQWPYARGCPRTGSIYQEPWLDLCTMCGGLSDRGRMRVCWTVACTEGVAQCDAVWLCCSLEDMSNRCRKLQSVLVPPRLTPILLEGCHMHGWKTHAHEAVLFFQASPSFSRHTQRCLYLALSVDSECANPIDVVECTEHRFGSRFHQISSECAFTGTKFGHCNLV
eukprot:364794-Chlamydomonas_euryale.AAC.2